MKHQWVSEQTYLTSWAGVTQMFSSKDFWCSKVKKVAFLQHCSSLWNWKHEKAFSDYGEYMNWPDLTFKMEDLIEKRFLQTMEARKNGSCVLSCYQKSLVFFWITNKNYQDVKRYTIRSWKAKEWGLVSRYEWEAKTTAILKVFHEKQTIRDQREIHLQPSQR